MSYSLTLKFTASLELTNKWHLSALLFRKLFLNHSSNAFDAFSKDTPLMSSSITYAVLSSAELAISDLRSQACNFIKKETGKGVFL